LYAGSHGFTNAFPYTSCPSTRSWIRISSNVQWTYSGGGDTKAEVDSVLCSDDLDTLRVVAAPIDSVLEQEPSFKKRASFSTTTWTFFVLFDTLVSRSPDTDLPRLRLSTSSSEASEDASELVSEPEPLLSKVLGWLSMSEVLSC